MNDINYYMTLPYKMEIIPDTESGYVASYPDLKGCLSCGETIEDAVKNVNEAKKIWLQAAIEDGYSIPVPQKKISYSGQFKLRIPKSLHHQLALHANQEGVSMNQYCLYLLSSRDATRAQKIKSNRI